METLKQLKDLDLRFSATLLASLTSLQGGPTPTPTNICDIATCYTPEQQGEFLVAGVKILAVIGSAWLSLHFLTNFLTHGQHVTTEHSVHLPSQQEKDQEQLEKLKSKGYNPEQRLANLLKTRAEIQEEIDFLNQINQG